MHKYTDAYVGNIAKANAVGTSTATLILTQPAIGDYHLIEWIAWSYVTPAAGARLTVTDITHGIVLLDLSLGNQQYDLFEFGGRGFAAPEESAIKIELLGNKDKTITVQHL